MISPSRIVSARSRGTTLYGVLASICVPALDSVKFDAALIIVVLEDRDGDGLDVRPIDAAPVVRPSSAARCWCSAPPGLPEPLMVRHSPRADRDGDRKTTANLRVTFQDVHRFNAAGRRILDRRVPAPSAGPRRQLEGTAGRIPARSPGSGTAAIAHAGACAIATFAFSPRASAGTPLQVLVSVGRAARLIRPAVEVGGPVQLVTRLRSSCTTSSGMFSCASADISR